MLAAAQ